MRTSLLNDRSIRPTEYRNWRNARGYLTSRPKHRERVEELKASIAWLCSRVAALAQLL